MRLIFFEIDHYLYTIPLIIIFIYVTFLRKINEENRNRFCVCLSNVTSFSFLLILIISSINVIHGEYSLNISIVFIFTILNLFFSLVLYKFSNVSGFCDKLIFLLKILIVACILLLIVYKYFVGGISNIERYSSIVVYLVGFLFLTEKK